MLDFFQEIHNSLSSGKELVVATIISDSGSTPRTAGSKMIVYGDGHISGTIGGGAVEGDAIGKALNLFETRGCDLVSYDLNHNSNRTRMDLICGGRMQVLLEYVPVTSLDMEIYQTVCEQIRQSRPCVLIGKVSEANDQITVQRAVVTAEKKSIGAFQLTDEDFEVLEKGGKHTMNTNLVEVAQQRYLVERILPPETIYLVGGGHVSKEIAGLTKYLGFRTIVIDDRAEFANTERFKDVDGVKVCPGFFDVFKDFEITADSYIIIVTRGHSFDKEVLSQALRTEAGYIGMIGSRRKRESIYQKLIDEGLERSLLEKVYCPIGVPIEAETPAEIGISVVAQLIQHRAGRKNRG